MNRLFILLVFCSAVLMETAVAQRSEKYDGEYADFYRAEELFEKEQYSAARKTFELFLSQLTDPNDPMHQKARYYEGLSALNLYTNDAIELLTRFNLDYPENIHKNEIYFKIGQNYYQSKKYVDATEWFERTNLSQIDTAFHAEYYFKKGYAHFQLGETSEARNALFEVKDGNTKYAAPATYYFSHIAYQNESYQVALEGFNKLKNDPTFEKEVPYFITQIYYLQGDFESVIKYAPETSGDIKDKNAAEMSQLIGDAYYRVGRYDEAVSHLEDYSRRSQTSREDDYQLGYAYYKSTYYDKAIGMFERVSRSKDKLGQVALYHAAECYLKQEELNYARSAFEGAADIDADVEIQEDALYQYAILSYELDYNPYNEATRAFERFLEEFPNSKRKGDVYEYLVNVYANTKQYDEALASLDRIEKKDIRLKTAYQIIAYNKGIEQYQRNNFMDAVEALKLVDRYPVDNNLTGKALFWQGEAFYAMRKYVDAIKKYRAFIAVPSSSNKDLKEAAYYNIGYAYYEQEDYIQAIEAFRTFTQLPSNKDYVRLADAYTRIGDAYYTKKEPAFENAAINYEKAVELNTDNVDRSLFYLAKVYGFIPDKRMSKITTLLDIVNNHSNSQYIVPAIFEIGISYKYEGNLSDGLRYFNQIIRDYPKNILVKDALIEVGDIKYKQKDYQGAESYFKRVLNEYNLNDIECKTATKGLQDIYRATRQQEKITEIAQKYPCAEITEDDQESFFYETANELYLDENYDEAIPEINKYLNEYPNGRFSIQLTSYLADIYYQSDQKGQALALYEKIIEKPTSAYTEEALIRASKTLYNEKEYDRALPYYARLEKLASTPQVIYNTRVGLMRCNYLLEFYPNASDIAIKVVKNQLASDNIQLEANYIAGMSLYKQKLYEKAIPYLKTTEQKNDGERGTEALYTIADCHYKLKEYDEAETVHKQLMSRKPAYDYWIAKSLILQARVFMVTEELLQAENTINLVLKNYPDNDDGILLEAEKLKTELMQLKDAPKSTDNDTNRVIDLEEGGNDD